MKNSRVRPRSVQCYDLVSDNVLACAETLWDLHSDNVVILVKYVCSSPFSTRVFTGLVDLEPNSAMVDKKVNDHVTIEFWQQFVRITRIPFGDI